MQSQPLAFLITRYMSYQFISSRYKNSERKSRAVRVHEKKNIIHKKVKFHTGFNQ